MILYKRNAQGKPIFWQIQDLGGAIGVKYGLVGKEGHVETYKTHRNVEDEIKSAIKAKRDEGYKALQDLYDNAPEDIDKEHLFLYLDSYLPKFNTHSDGAFIPMLCKTLEDNKPFEKGNYFGQWKINGERCIITASITSGLFSEIKLHYRSRKGIDWTNKLSYLDGYIIPCIPDDLLDMMIEEGVGLDGELYLPGYCINEINSFIKNTELLQHYKLQFWCYDLCIDSMSAAARQVQLETCFSKFIPDIKSKEDHLNNENIFVMLPNVDVMDINKAILYRDNCYSRRRS
jgi:predicted DNA-binding WGR domain protein